MTHAPWGKLEFYDSKRARPTLAHAPLHGRHANACPESTNREAELNVGDELCAAHVRSEVFAPAR